MHKRSIYIIKKGFQLRYTRLLIVSIICFCILVVLNTAFFLFKYDAIFKEIPAAREAVFTFATMLFIILILFGTFLSIYAIFVSHTVAGPLYRFEQTLNSVHDGDLTIRSNIRKDDELRDFQDILNSMIIKIHMNIKQDKEHARVIAATLKTAYENIANDPNLSASCGALSQDLKACILKVESIGKYFKI